MKLIKSLIFLLFFLAAGPAAHAQSSGLSISPPTVEILLSPTKKVTQAFTIKNQGKSSQFMATLHKFTPNGTNGQVKLDPQPLDLASLPLIVNLSSPDLHFGEPFTINPGSSTQLVLSLEGASTDLAVDTYLGLVVQPVSAGTLPTATPGITALLLTTLTPTSVLPVNLSVENFELPFLHDTASPLNLSPLIKNNSPIMLRPLGSLEIISPRGRTTSLPLYPNLILGDSSRRILGQCGQESCPLTFTPSWFNFGPYRLRLIITTQGGTKLSEVERTVWLLPLKTGTMVLALLILSLGVGLYQRRMRKL